MKDIGLHSGDLMVVDKAEKPRQGDIVIAETDGEFTVKRLQLKPHIALLPMNPPTLPFTLKNCRYSASSRRLSIKPGGQADVFARRRELFRRQLREGISA